MKLHRSARQGPRVSRRTVLRGLGAAVALPMLEAMVPGRAFAQSAAVAPLRFLAFYVPCGIHMDKWRPSSTGKDYGLTSILSPLASVKDKVLVLSGLDNFPATDQGDGPGGHARGTSTFLTCVHPERDRVKIGVSVDQLVADHYGTATALRSLELGCEGGGGAGECDSGYSCAYQRAISWASSTTPMPKEINPRLVFDRVFAGSDATLTAEQLARRRREDLSILDFVKEDTVRLSASLGAGDKRKLDEYFTGLRELETRVEASADLDPGCMELTAPEGVATDDDEYVRTMVDLMVLAVRCDRTRVATFMLGNGGSTRTFPYLGINSAHHELSHHQGVKDKLDALEAINTWEVRMYTRLLEQLDLIEEPLPDGSMGTALDNTVAVFGSELADGDAHENHNMPLLVGGRAGGRLKSGRHVKFSSGTPQADMYLTLLHAMGIERDRFGDDGEDILDELLV